MTAYTKTLILSLLLCLVLPGEVVSQRDSFFVIELGKYEKPSFDSFAAFRQLGIVYEVPVKKEPSVIILGGYTEKEEAERIFNLLPESSQFTPEISVVPLKKRKPMRTVQLALFEVGTPIDWEGFFQQGFPVFAIQENDVLRITAGDFRNARRQQKGLEEIREKGFLKAYSKTFPEEMAIKIGTFEAGKTQENFLRPSLLPTVETSTEQVETPVSSQLNLLSTSHNEYPPIAPTLAKNSTQQLQDILKELGFFQDSIDGIYDNATANAYLQFTTDNEQWIKYTILGTQWVQDKTYKGGSLTQNAISMLGKQPEIALPILNSTNHPLAIGYLQLHKFLAQGPGTEISAQTQNAIKTARLGKEVDSTYFQKTVSLGFENLPDLLRGIAFLHQMYPSFKVPCWIFEKEPKLSDLAFTPAPAYRNFDYRLEHCEEFSTWSEIKTLKAITKDLSIVPIDSLNTLSLLYHTGFLTDSLFNVEMEKWEQDYIQQVKDWTKKPGFPSRVGSVFQVAFYQSLIRLQAYYAAKNSPENDALNLARASLRLLTGTSFEPEKQH
jgi:hypothetical protein